MPAKRRLTMRQLRQMLRLAGSGTSSREIAVVLGVARSTVQDNLKRAAQAGLTWPLPGELTDDALEHRLFARAGVKQGQRRREEPDWAEISIELKKPGVTLLILWEEYRSDHTDGYGYSRFCELFRGFEQRLSPTMRQEHAAGDKVFVDYSGKKVPIVDRKTGKTYTSEAFLTAPSDQMYSDYGFFSTFEGPGGNRIAIVSGTRDAAVMGVAETLTRIESLERFQKKVGATPDFESLLVVKGQKHTNLEAQVITNYTLDSRSIWAGSTANTASYPTK